MNKQKKAWVLLQTLVKEENLNVSIVGVYDNREDLERGIRNDLEFFWSYLVGDLKHADGSMTSDELHEQAVNEGVEDLMTVDGFVLSGRNFRWNVQEVTLNKNVE